MKEGKYYPLFLYLRDIDKESVTLKFKNIEKIIGTSLPPYMRKYANSWYGRTSSKDAPSQKVAWENAGYICSFVDLDKEIVTFTQERRINRDNLTLHQMMDEALYLIGDKIKPNKERQYDLTNPFDITFKALNLYLLHHKKANKEIRSLFNQVLESDDIRAIYLANFIIMLLDKSLKDLSDIMSNKILKASEKDFDFLLDELAK